jgi:hypothetical protein
MIAGIVNKSSKGEGMFYNGPRELDAEVWTEILSNKEITTELDLRILKLVYESKNQGMGASEIASKLNVAHHVRVNQQIGKFSKRVVAKTGVQPPLKSDGKPRWRDVLFLGYEEGGRLPWIMRPELVAAFKKVVDQDVAEDDFWENIKISVGDLTIPPVMFPFVHAFGIAFYCWFVTQCFGTFYYAIVYKTSILLFQICPKNEGDAKHSYE